MLSSIHITTWLIPCCIFFLSMTSLKRQRWTNALWHWNNTLFARTMIYICILMNIVWIMSTDISNEVPDVRLLKGCQYYKCVPFEGLNVFHYVYSNKHNMMQYFLIFICHTIYCLRFSQFKGPSYKAN